MHITGWSIQIPIPVALAVVATMGYLISRWRRPAASDVAIRSRRELKTRASRGVGFGENRADGSPKPGETSRQHVEVQGSRRPAERSTAGGRLERPLPGGREHSQADAATGHADRQRLRRDPPAKRESDDLHRGPNRSADRREQPAGAGRRLGRPTRADEPLPFTLLAGHARHRPLQAGERPRRPSERRSRLAAAFPTVGRVRARDRHRWRDTAAKSSSSSCRKPIWPARAC